MLQYLGSLFFVLKAGVAGGSCNNGVTMLLISSLAICSSLILFDGGCSVGESFGITMTSSRLNGDCEATSIGSVFIVILKIHNDIINQ